MLVLQVSCMSSLNVQKYKLCFRFMKEKSSVSSCFSRKSIVRLQETWNIVRKLCMDPCSKPIRLYFIEHQKRRFDKCSCRSFPRILIRACQGQESTKRHRKSWPYDSCNVFQVFACNMHIKDVIKDVVVPESMLNLKISAISHVKHRKSCLYFPTSKISQNLCFSFLKQIMS